MKENKVRDHKLHYGNIAILKDHAMVVGNPLGGPVDPLFEDVMPEGGGIITIISGKVSWATPWEKVSFYGSGVIMFDSIGQVPRLIFSKDFKGYLIGLFKNYFSSMLVDFTRSGFPSRIAGGPVMVQTGPETSSMLTRVNMLLVEEITNGKGNSRIEIARLLIKTLYCKIMDLLEMHPDDSDHSSTEMIVKEFFGLLHKYGSTQRNLVFYAERIGLTAKYLSSVITKVTGKPSRKWFEEMTINKACFLLRSTNLTISQISSMLNFPTPSCFTRYFCSAQNTTPQKYRESILK